jgi:SAM-dependent methyltransferase
MEKKNCRVCGKVDPKMFLSLGETPLANSFLSKEDLTKDEDKFPLETAYCDNCHFVQLNYVVPGEVMFKNYIYVSSTSNTFNIHFSEMAEVVKEILDLNDKSLAVDIGSNDGILINWFKKVGVKCVGVEPATNIAKIANEKGFETINEFFSENSVNQIVTKYGNADVVTACNVFAHIDDIDSVVENVKKLLKKDGVYVIEFQYLVNTIEDMTFDNIYHEHVSYYSLTSISYFFKKHGMKIFRADKVSSHGGSLRIFVKNDEGNHEMDKSVQDTLDYEKKIGIDAIELYENFANKVNGIKEKLVSTVKDLKKQGKVIAGFGAPAKGNTMLNFCQLGKEDIDYIVDENPLKVGLFTPGTHIPVESMKMLDEKKPDYIIILAWNFADEILQKTKKYAEHGVKFIIALPEFRIV